MNLPSSTSLRRATTSATSSSVQRLLQSRNVTRARLTPRTTARRHVLCASRGSQSFLVLGTENNLWMHCQSKPQDVHAGCPQPWAVPTLDAPSILRCWWEPGASTSLHNPWKLTGLPTLHHCSEQLPRQYVPCLLLPDRAEHVFQWAKNRGLTTGAFRPAHGMQVSNHTHLYDCPIPSTGPYKNTCVPEPTHMNHIHLTQTIKPGPERAQKNVRNDM